MSKRKLTGAETPLERAVQRIANGYAADYDDGVAGFLNDLFHGGSELIYYTDTIAWYKKHAEEIDAMLAEACEDSGLRPDELFERAGWEKPVPWAVICIDKRTVRQLLVTLERLPASVAWIFTTTSEGQDAMFEGCIEAHPLVHRCTVLALSAQGLCKPFARHAKAIAEDEGLNGQPLSAYERLAKRNHNSLRAMLQEIEAPATLAETRTVDLTRRRVQEIEADTAKSWFGEWEKSDPLARARGDINRNILAWFGFEETARRLADRNGIEA